MKKYISNKNVVYFYITLIIYIMDVKNINKHSDNLIDIMNDKPSELRYNNRKYHRGNY